MAHVLLIDDDIELSEMLREYLRHDGFEVAVANDGQSGIAAALAGNCDLVVLDVMMPGINGIEVLRRIRSQSRLPVLMLTARGDELDRILGLELGADDYVPKPCAPRELVARIRAILRRAQPDATAGVLTSGALSLWPERRHAELAGRVLELTSAEFGLLEVLLRNIGRVVGKAELSEAGLGRPLARFDRSVDVHISAIRQKLGGHIDGRSWVQTVRSVGYQLVRE
jgi:two-component system OmpR family response regulator/two-component system response regulator CpxR